MTDAFYQSIFATRLSKQKNSAAKFTTEQRGFRLATSVGGTLTRRGADYLIIDDPHKLEDALSEVKRESVITWYDHTLRSSLDSQKYGCIIVIMQRLHEDDLVGHLISDGGWTLLSFPAIAEVDERYTVSTLGGSRTVCRKAGEALPCGDLRPKSIVIEDKASGTQLL